MMIIPGQRRISKDGSHEAFEQEWKPFLRSMFLSVACAVAPEPALASMLFYAANENERSECVSLIVNIAEKNEKNEGYVITKLKELSAEAGKNQAQIHELVDNLLQRDGEQYAWGIVDFLRCRLLESKTGTPPMPSILLRIADLAELSEEEITILAVLYAAKENEAFENLIRQASSVRANYILSVAAGMQIPEFSRLIGDKSRLTLMGLIDIGGRFSSFSDAALDSRIDFTIGTGCEEHLYSGLYMEERAARFPLDAFNVASRDQFFILNLLEAKKSILIQGSPGVGKTEFAYAVGASLERKVRLLSTKAEDIESYGRRVGSKDRKKIAFLASRFINPEKELLVIDEADVLLQSATGFFSLFGGGSYDKGEINAILDELTVPVVWIANDISQVPDSTLRRFAYVYEFPRPDLKTRSRILIDRVKEEGLSISENYLEGISRTYDLTPSAIDRLVNAVSASIKALQPDVGCMKTEAYFLDYLKSMSKGPTKPDFKPRKALPDTFDLDLCNTSLPAHELEELVRKRKASGKPTRLLFSGDPGGGKTQFALYLAEALEMDAMIQKPSDILSKYVGEAEKNIARMFREAEQQKSLLIIDEADALLMDRSNLNLSWEMSQAAEWLQGIQSFSGTLIACTNRFDSVDPALRRRFQRQIAFDPLRPEQILLAFIRFFPEALRDESILAPLYQRTLMISDFATAAELLEDETKTEIIVREVLANAEVRRTERSIGF